MTELMKATAPLFKGLLLGVIRSRPLRRTLPSTHGVNERHITTILDPGRARGGELDDPHTRKLLINKVWNNLIGITHVDNVPPLQATMARF